ncbi:MAG: hypothetical protein ACOH5I_09940 [Oligoflexus sp.]
MEQSNQERVQHGLCRKLSFLQAVLGASLWITPVQAQDGKKQPTSTGSSANQTQITQEYQQAIDPKAQELSKRIAEVLTEMGQLMEKTAEENVDPAIIQRLRQLNAQYEQLSWEYEMYFGEGEFIDMENEARMESGLEPGPQLTIQEIQELTQR